MGSHRITVHERKLGKAKLVGLRTQDGYWTIKPDQATIGTLYTVDLNSARVGVFFNIPSQKQFRCEVIDTREDCDGQFYHFPTELLEIQP